MSNNECINKESGIKSDSSISHKSEIKENINYQTIAIYMMKLLKQSKFVGLS